MSGSIRPGNGIDNVCIEQSRSDVVQAMGDPLSVRHGGETEILYYPGIEVFLSHGVVGMIVADLSYRGSTPDGVTTGIAWADLVRVVEGVVWDEEQDLWQAADRSRVWYQVVRPAMAVEQPLDPPYVPERYGVHDPDAFVRYIFVM